MCFEDVFWDGVLRWCFEEVFWGGVLKWGFHRAFNVVLGRTLPSCRLHKNVTKSFVFVTILELGVSPYKPPHCTDVHQFSVCNTCRPLPINQLVICTRQWWILFEELKKNERNVRKMKKTKSKSKKQKGKSKTPRAIKAKAKNSEPRGKIQEQKAKSEKQIVKSQSKKAKSKK